MHTTIGVPEDLMTGRRRHNLMEDVTERFYRLTSYVRHYAWGMRRHGDTVPYIAELLGEDPGKNIPWAFY